MDVGNFAEEFTTMAPVDSPAFPPQSAKRFAQLFRVRLSFLQRCLSSGSAVVYIMLKSVDTLSHSWNTSNFALIFTVYKSIYHALLSRLFCSSLDLLII